MVLLLVPGCISNIFKEPKPTFSNEIILPELPESFNRLKTPIYPSWKNKNTGNVITVISDCNEGLYNLKSIHQLMIDSIDRPQIIDEKETQINQRLSYYKKIKGSVDEKTVVIESYSVQQNKCLYIFSLAGKPDGLSANKKDFLQFVEKMSFKK